MVRKVDFWFFIVLATVMLRGCIPALASAVGDNAVPVVHTGPDGTLAYISDSLGNRVPDFSYCGYMASEKPIPMAPVKVVVPLPEGDATERIQSAIDYVASLPVDANGIKGAVLLQKGQYSLHGRLVIRSSGVVLRGSGTGEDGTVLIAAGKDRETLIRIVGAGRPEKSEEQPILQDYVPVNSFRVVVHDGSLFQAGTRVCVRRPSTREWIEGLDMGDFGGESGWLAWKPGERDLIWDRTITDVEGNTLILDAPLTTALDGKYGGGFVASYEWPERISQVGIENMTLVSEYDASNLKDEEHCWQAITFEKVRDAWVRQISFRHFAGSAVAVYEDASRITIEDCLSLCPVSEIGGWRRYSFFTTGQQTLFQRLYAEHGYHDFATGFCAAGPNAFVQCESYLPYSFSGTIDSWASGVLFDIINIDGQALSLKNRTQDAYGAGWTAANCMLWQCSAARIDCYKPPTAQNWAFGAWAQFAGNGYWNDVNNHINPRSLFYDQLADRLGKKAVPANPVMEITTNASSSPTVEMAAKLVGQSEDPALTLREWIENAGTRNPIETEPGNAPLSDKLNVTKNSSAENRESLKNRKLPKSVKSAEFMESAKSMGSVKYGQPETPNLVVRDGWLAWGDRVLTGQRHSVPWWSGNLRPGKLAQARPALTRYVPGRHGIGYTDNLEEVVEWMKQENVIGIEQNYALWYDRRRDDHQRVRRMDGETWAPFYELPFARTGQGLAWDGLSKYDLTKYNPWYWSRLKQFGTLADREGLILIHHNYFQHNILEAGAHWVDFPWRTANNINDTGFPEPPPFAGDKRIFMAEQFYDLSDSLCRNLHRAYIRQCLDNFKDNSGVIQMIGAEFTGPLHFVQFWIDVIREWEQETGRRPVIGLSTTKDVQDSILADPVRSQVVDMIDIRYWSSRADGSLYAPAGGQNLAPRQHARLENPGKRSFEQVYNDVFTYRKRFPEKAVMYSETRSENTAWAVFMAGGSLAGIPRIEIRGFLENACTMYPEATGNQLVRKLRNSNGECILYMGSGQVTGNSQDVGIRQVSGYSMCLPDGKFSLVKIDPASGKTIGKIQKLTGRQQFELPTPEEGPVVLWITKDKMPEQQYKIGVIDLMLLKRQKLGALPLAKEIGADGVEIDMGGLGNRPTFDNKLSDRGIRQQFLDVADSLGLEISSLAMTGFYAQSFPARDSVENIVQDCINTMTLMGVKMAFLPLGVEGDLVKYPERRRVVVERLRNIGQRAEAAGMIIAIETALDAQGEVGLLDEIGSPAIQISFNFSNPLAAGRDLCRELEILGKDRICKIHCTNKDGVWLQNDQQIDMQQVRKTLDRMGWSGWLMVERSRDANNPRDVRGNFGANAAYLKSIFQQ